MEMLERKDDLQKEKAEWGEETDLLLDLYREYVKQIGPSKTFKTKKRMWERISIDIYEKRKIARTAVQCETRYKTIKRRKGPTNVNNKELEALDDLVEIVYDDDEEEEDDDCSDSSEDNMNTISMQKKHKNRKQNQIRKTETTSVSKRKNKEDNELVETLLLIHRAEEAAREQRHLEKMDLLRKLTDAITKMTECVTNTRKNNN